MMMKQRIFHRRGGLLVASLLFVLLSANAKTMNDGRYEIANGLDSNKRGYATDYPNAEYFDVYSPLIRTNYAQVFWAQMETVPLPPEIIERFTNRTMAIVGYEVDQVRRVPNAAGEMEDVSVPITHAYNHHYIASLSNNRQGRMVSRPVPLDLQHKVMTHGTEEVWDFVPHSSASSTHNGDGIPHAQIFSEANGGEMRLSYHGYPQGYAQLIHGPNSWSIQPMQIDTFHRDHPGPKFVPGPLPKISPMYNITNDVLYSGLLECPCSTAIEKKWWYHYKLLLDKTSGLEENTKECLEADNIQNATECFQAGAYVVPSPNIRHFNYTVNETVPYGCTVVRRAGNNGAVLEITWNRPPENVSEEASVAEAPRQVIAYASGVIHATVTLTSSLDADNANGMATIHLEGPADAWFGIGFDTQNMCRRKMEGDECPSDGPYAILVYDDKVEERALDFHGMGQVLPPDSSWNFTVVSNQVTTNGTHRVVVLERPLVGPDDRYFSFDMDEPDLPIIMATGCNMTLAQHCGHGASQLAFMATDTPMSVCRDGIQATVGGKNFREGSRCAPFPTSTLVEQGNPTCSVHTYQGGLHCCKHMQSLLDTDQETPWKDQPLEYHMKFRYYFEEYTPARALISSSEDLASEDLASAQLVAIQASHQNLVRMYWMTEANAGEYDIVQCPAGTPPSQCIQIISSRWPVKNMIAGCDGPWCAGKDLKKADGVELIYAGPHCHAPSCISMELYNADTGELLCRVEPRPGRSTDKVFDEMGFLAIPPCLWGHEEGLAQPVFLSMNTTLLSIKRNNNTHAHFGEMASWQMRGVLAMAHTDAGSGKGEQGRSREQVVADKERASSWNSMAQTEETADLSTDTRTSVRKSKPVV